MHLVGTRRSVVVVAPSGTSRCRRCTQRIEKGAVRLGVARDVSGSAFDWFHLTCEPRTDLFEWLDLLERLPAFGSTADVVRERVARDYSDHSFSSVHDGSDVTAYWWATRDPTALDVLDHTRGPVFREQLSLPRGRLEALVHRTSMEKRPDPLWVRAILGWFERSPFSNAWSIWTSATRLADRFADPTVHRAVQTCFERGPDAWNAHVGRFAGPLVWPWIERRAQVGYLSVARPLRVPTDRENALLSEWVDRTNRHEEREEQLEQDRGSLLHAASAGDEGALLVLADAWISEGDPRGEYIQLVLAGRLQGERRVRRNTLQKDWRRLLGPLSAFLLKRDLRFRRGLPISGVGKTPRGHDLDRVRDAIEWASLESLELVPDGQGRVEIGLLFAPHARRLRRVVLPDMDAADALFDEEVSVSPTIEEVEIRSADTWGRGAEPHPPSLPALKRVVAYGPETKWRLGSVDIGFT